MKRVALSVFFILTSVFSFSQTGEEAFIADNSIHFKLGATINLNNAVLFKSLNDIEDGDGRFTSAKQLNFNPLVEIDFERHIAKHFGLMVHIGFTQTRSSYIYDNTVDVNSVAVNFHETGLVTANIPNVGLMPVFYMKNTRFMLGTGLYKYYYSFKPMDVGYVHFNLNMEGTMIYNKVSVMQVFRLSSCNLTLTGSYFGFLKKFDNGFQLSLGLEI